MAVVIYRLQLHPISCILIYMPLSGKQDFKESRVKKTMMRYWAKIKQQKDRSYLVEFPGLDGCFTEGSSLDEALNHAKEALDGWLAARCDRNLNIPKSVPRKGRNFYSIEVSLTIAFVMRLRRLRKKRGLSQAEVARKLGISQQAYAKIETPLKTNPSLHTIQRISTALDADVDLLLAA